MKKNISSDDLRRLAARAATINDRLEGGYIPVKTALSAEKADRRLRKMCKSVAGEDWQLFEEHLRKYDGLSIDKVKSLLGDVELAKCESTPQWMDTFLWAFEAMTCSKLVKCHEKNTSDNDCQLPFEDIFSPLVSTAWDRLNLSCFQIDLLLSRSAQRAAQRVLTQRLSDICSPTLYECFLIFSMQQNSSAIYLGLPMKGSSNSRLNYDGFITSLRKGGLWTYFENRPVLARLVGRITELWMVTMAELIQRIYIDMEQISQTFCGGEPIGHVTNLIGPLSDPHNGGRRVFRLSFANGLTVAYKPKDVGIYVSWREFLRWIEDQKGPPICLAPIVLERKGYGWIKWIEPKPCLSTTKAHNFFQRAGASLCLFHLLQGTDLHIENIVAYGEFPAPVDLETLFHPNFFSTCFSSTKNLNNPMATACRLLDESVLATGYLPNWIILPGHDQPFGVGGLNPEENNISNQWSFRNRNSDAMTLERIPRPKARGSHVPTLRGYPLSSISFRIDVMNGYEIMYRFLMHKRMSVKAKDGPIEVFRKQIVRVVMRSTQFYAELIRRSLDSQNLADGADFSIPLFFLERDYDLSKKQELTRILRNDERRSLQDLDIPYFTCGTTDRHLLSSGNIIIHNYLFHASFNNVSQRLKTLRCTTLNQQLEFIAQTLQTKDDSQSHETWQTKIVLKTQNKPLTVDTAITHASLFADVLHRKAIREGEGTAWIGHVPLPGEKRSKFQVIGYDLYAGNAGIALFLASLYRLTQWRPHRDLVLSALYPYCIEIESIENGPRLINSLGLGGGTGIGSVIYSLVRSANLIDAPELFDYAEKSLRFISHLSISADKIFDVMGGAAGAILGLLALHRAKPRSDAFEIAVACGRHLLANQLISATKGGWETYANRSLTGFSHGAAGIILALLRLYKESGDTEFLEGAKNGIKFENGFFSLQAENWPDFRNGHKLINSPSYAFNWCHGAPGIGLARVGGLDALDNSDIQSNINAAIKTTVCSPIASMDHLCCGNFGRLEFLFTAGRRLGMEEMTTFSLKCAALLACMADKSGTYRFPSGDGKYNPGFFTGISGVGYQLLRFVYPDIFPSVLLWESED